MVMGECLAFSSLQAYRWTQKSSLQLGLRVGGHLALTDFHSEDPKWTFACGFMSLVMSIWISSCVLLRVWLWLWLLWCRLPVPQQRFGSLFLELASKVQTLYFKYSANHPSAVAVLQSKRYLICSRNLKKDIRKKLNRDKKLVLSFITLLRVILNTTRDDKGPLERPQLLTHKTVDMRHIIDLIKDINFYHCL